MTETLAASLLQQAVELHQQGRLQPAQALYRQVLELNPQQFDALHLLGVIARQQGDAAGAIELISRAIAISDGQANAHCNLGVALLDVGQAGEALASHERALALNPSYALAWSNRGNALRRLGRLDDALDSYQRALAIQPQYAEAHCNRAIVLQDQGRYLDALGAAEDALNLKDRYADAWLARGHALHCLRHLPEAVESFDRAIHLRPDWAQAYGAQGASLQRLGEFAAALDSYDQALKHQPDYALAHYQRGNALRSLDRREEAIAAYRAALAHGDNPETIAFALASVGEGETPASLPNDYVRSLFDQYANYFDQHLTEVLGYKTPAVLDALLRHVAPSSELSTVDLGCGTGLCAPYLRAYSRKLYGIDLSQQMLDKAAERGLYDELACADLLAYLHGRDAAFDLAVAADVFVYIGDLAPVFRAVHATLRPGGRFCFSVEAGEGADYMLRPSNRYAHTLEYLQRLATQTGFKVLATQALDAREENGAPIAAHALVLCK
ncbi:MULTISPECIES: tetratricopeptide repeat protein [unclassified Duganella]|uniref:tetratricopeptide repeat protein n=1 Tax=unclassified Duganella TaxID=2636909 RepID=UPI00088FE62B|nr:MULTISPECIES: tetratricopeptide repeat protein [unclassified Duganella]SDG65879.1 Predicted methyltransferase, contains TPR repeat [Duganella sp. OV458]SDJ91079.1 Predicted methyltransferase, contains TPR repeat [Duganella sp. OV510]